MCNVRINPTNPFLVQYTIIEFGRSAIYGQIVQYVPPSEVWMDQLILMMCRIVFMSCIKPIHLYVYNDAYNNVMNEEMCVD